MNQHDINMNTIDANSVAAERNENKMNLENGFYNIVNGERISTSKKRSVIHVAIKHQLAAVPDLEHGLGKDDSRMIADRRRIALGGKIEVVPVNRKPGRSGLASTLFEILSFQPTRMKTQVLVWSLSRKASYHFADLP